MMRLWLVASCGACAAAVSSPASKVVWSPKFAAHATPSGHPECAARTAACNAYLAEHPVAGREIVEIERLRPGLADALARVHASEYLDMLAEPVAAGERRALDADTWLSRASWNVTRLATSAWLEALDHALKTDGVGVAVTRPPGHHATATAAMGFCTLNHAAVAIAEALTRCSRVAALDVDVHLSASRQLAI